MVYYRIFHRSTQAGFLFLVDTDGYLGLPPSLLQLGHRRSRDGLPSADPSSRSPVEPRNVSSNDMPCVSSFDHRFWSSPYLIGHGLVPSIIFVGSFSSVSPCLCLLVADIAFALLSHTASFETLFLHLLRSWFCQTSMTLRHLKCKDHQ